ncbi:hypothetical protein ACFSWE_13225 [Leucobacter albus]|uniref:Uncharacterized protein n=1 Tax=Leucobacter albus TaxID=272210 RepID=A0ABW3TRT5_9MICO
MSFPEVLKQPSTFVAAALVTACLLALLAAIGGFLLINQATQTALAVRPAAPSVVHQQDGAGQAARAAARTAEYSTIAS